jgi:hypothetical protein
VRGGYRSFLLLQKSQAIWAQSLTTLQGEMRQSLVSGQHPSDVENLFRSLP